MTFSIIFFSLGYIVGVQIGGRLYNYYLIFSISIVLAILGGAYSLFVLEESLEKLPPSPDSSSHLFDIKAIAECAKTTFRPRPGKRRPLLLAFLFLFQVFSLCVNTTDFDYLMTRLKFNWEKENFSNYLTVQRICRLLGKFLPLFPSLHVYVINSVGLSFVLNVQQ